MKDSATPAERLRRNAAEAEALLKQLASTGRLMILCSLMDGEKSVTELASIADLSQSAVSQHLMKLRQARLVETDKRGQMVYYRLSDMPVRALLTTLYLIFCK